jgi:tetratricopeptide (TPR) repeat protein
MLGESANAALGFAAPPEIEHHLRQAAQVYHDTLAAERILLRVLEMDPQCLTVYFSLYKFYFYKHRLHDAEHIALRALAMAAAQGDFDPDWTKLHSQSAPWQRVDGPQHFYLFTLKALAFMRLRQHQPAAARALLAKLAELDPADQVGASVIRDLAAGVQERTAGTA